MVVDGVSSKVTCTPCSVPQGSVLGPVLFILYVADLADIVAEYISLHVYADKTELMWTSSKLNVSKIVVL